jgi:hypothetical protein
MTSDRQPGDPLAWARRLAAIQGGVVDRQQLLACGASASRVKRLLATGWLIKRFSGVYALGHEAITQRGKLVAALLYAGFGSAISHTTAADLHRLIARASPVIHVSTCRKRRSVSGVAIHRPREIRSVVLNGIPITNPSQTLVDIAPRCDDYELQKALANADFHDLLDAESIKTVVGRGHSGSARLRAAIAEHMPELGETLSYLEDLLLLLCQRHEIPLPAPNRRIKRHKPDGVWPEEMVIVELDGGANHSSPTQRRVDAERDMYLRGLGYLVLRYTYWQVKRQGAAVAAELITTLAARARSAN